MSELFAYDFLRHAVVAGLLASILSGVVGTFVVVKRLTFVSGGVSHAAFGGLGAFLYLGLDPRWGAAVVAVGSALVLARIGESRTGSRDAAIGVLWAVGMAVGVVLVSLTPGRAPDLAAYLFGNILTIGASDVALTAGLAAAVLVLLALFSKELVAVAFDEDFARVQGVPVRRTMALLLVAVALSVVFLIQLVGIILVIALLTIPPLVGLQLARNFTTAMVAATATGAVMTTGGLALSYALDLPSGPVMVLAGAAILGVVTGVRRLVERGGRGVVPSGPGG